MHRKRSDQMYINENSDLFECFFAGEGRDFISIKRKLIYQAEKMIDVITHNRIHAVGWENLTPYQQNTILECTCEIIRFLYENKDMIETPLASYSVNGVSMQFRFNSTVYSQSGVIMPLTTYARLMSTGLCYAGGME